MEKIVIWGTGKVANEIMTECLTLDQYEILGVIDNDSSVEGTKFYGLNVYSPDILLKWVDIIDKIVVLTVSYQEIYLQISKMDIRLLPKMDNQYYFYKRSIMKRYEKSEDRQIHEILDYLEDHCIDVFNYKFVEKYKKINSVVFKDEESGLFYVQYKGLNMFFSRSLKNEKEVLDYFRSILIEQDEKSPHRYMDEKFCVNEGDTVVDIGVAEGNFSIDIIEKAKKIYMIESDPLWIEALSHTFAGYRDKVCIIERFISSYDEGKIACLDNLIHEKVDFVKMDIEGCEHEALIGARKLLKKSKKVKMAVCCYHSDFDQLLIEDEMKKQGFRYTTTSGYMWYPSKIRQATVSTQLHRGIIRAEK